MIKMPVCPATITPLPDIEPVITYACRLSVDHEESHSDHLKARRGDPKDRANMVIVEYPAQQFTWKR